MVFQMLLCGQCYEHVYIYRRTAYPSFKVLNDLQRGYFGIQRSRNAL
jgi:hypothetical protein